MLCPLTKKLAHASFFVSVAQTSRMLYTFAISTYIHILYD